MAHIGKYRIKEYIRDNGQNPYREWLDSLDTKVRARIQARIFRVQLGNLGDINSVDDGVFEFRFFFGAGVRVYFGFDGSELVLLICGGIKRTQSKDIKIAHALWQEYLGSKHDE
jgi:putative addiction module killer protein